MTLKQQRFVKEYLTDFNATQAAIRAGYSQKGASVQGVRLLANAKVHEEIAHLSKRKDAELGLSNERILHRIAQVAFSDTFFAFKAQLAAFIEFLRTGVLPFPAEETVELMKLVIAGIQSREEGGREMDIEA